jgi:hypothetical protein
VTAAVAPAKPGFPYKTEPFYPRQRDIVRDTWHLPYHFYNMEQGTGKTWVSIVTMARLWLAGRIDAAIVLAPNNVHIAWAVEQLPLHMPDIVPWEAHVWLSDKERGWENRRKAGRVERADNPVLRLCKKPATFPILCVNSEAVTNDLVKRAIGTMLTMKRCILIVDESGDFTKPGGKRTRTLMNWRHRAPYRRCLDGTIMSTEPLELYSPYRFLSPSILGYDTFAQMKEDVAEWELIERGPEIMQDDGTWKRRAIPVIAKDPATGKKLWKNLDRVRARIAPHTTRVTKAEVLPWLPPKQYHKRFFSMTPEQWRMTSELWDENVTTVGDKTVTALNVLTIYLRLQQIAAGYVPTDIVYDDGDNERTQPIAVIPGPNPRLNAALDEVLAYNGAPTIIWCRFHFDIDLLQQILTEQGLRCVPYDGRMTQKAKEAAKTDFMGGRADVFVANTAAGGRGLNLQRAHKVLYYTNYFGLRKRLQSEDRPYRIGTDHRVDLTDLLGYRSIDMKIVKALRENKEVADVLSGDPVTEWI